MINHTGAVGACQPLESDATPKTPPPHADHRLVARYGTAALDDGYVAIPRVVIRRRHALGVTTAEWDYICEVWSYWRSNRLPGPSVEDLARGLNVDQSTIRRHRASLERKGLLRVIAEGPYNRYDLRPLIDAAVGLDRLQGAHEAHDAPVLGSLTSPPDDRAGLHATKEVEKKLDLDSIPPYPPLCENARFRTAESGVNERPPLSGHSPEQPEEVDDRRLATTFAALGTDLGDDAPDSSLARAHNLRRSADVSPDQFLQALAEATVRTRAHQAHILKRRRDGITPNGMPYLFAVLTDLLHPAPSHARRAPDRPRSDRRRRPEAPPVPVDYVAWTGATAEPAPTAGDPAASLPEENPTWRRALDELRGDMLRENYARWFAPTRVIGDDGATLRVAVPDAFHQQWLDRRLRGVIERAMGRVAPSWRVVFVVDPAACAPTETTARAS